MSKPSDAGTGRFSTWIAKARRYQENLEKRPWVAFPLESIRRFNKIEGKHLGHRDRLELVRRGDPR
jgi:hypothetical protein